MLADATVVLPQFLLVKSSRGAVALVDNESDVAADVSLGVLRAPRSALFGVHAAIPRCIHRRARFGTRRTSVRRPLGETTDCTIDSTGRAFAPAPPCISSQ